MSQNPSLIHALPDAGSPLRLPTTKTFTCRRPSRHPDGFLLQTREEETAEQLHTNFCFDLGCRCERQNKIPVHYSQTDMEFSTSGDGTIAGGGSVQTFCHGIKALDGRRPVNKDSCSAKKKGSRGPVCVCVRASDVAALECSVKVRNDLLSALDSCLTASCHHVIRDI